MIVVLAAPELRVPKRSNSPTVMSSVLSLVDSVAPEATVKALLFALALMVSIRQR